MCCCERPNINGTLGYRWQPFDAPGIRLADPPELAESETLLYDEPGRCGGIDNHCHHFRVVVGNGGRLWLLVRHGGAHGLWGIGFTLAGGRRREADQNKESSWGPGRDRKGQGVDRASGGWGWGRNWGGIWSRDPDPGQTLKRQMPRRQRAGLPRPLPVHRQDAGVGLAEVTVFLRGGLTAEVGRAGCVQTVAEVGGGGMEGQATGGTDQDCPAPGREVRAPSLAEFPIPLLRRLGEVVGQIGEGSAGSALGGNRAQGGEARVGGGRGRGFRASGAELGRRVGDGGQG